MRIRAHTLIAALALALLTPGCSLLPGHHQTDEQAPEDEDVPQDIGVHINNHNWSDIVVFAVRGTSRLRLGDVTAGNEADFVLPRNMTEGGQLTLVLHPIGGPRDFSTGPILVQPGQQIDVRVENAISQTNWTIS